jgi:hypothetical protein
VVDTIGGEALLAAVAPGDWRGLTISHHRAHGSAMSSSTSDEIVASCVARRAVG